jgi:hypothetical protein
VPGFGRQPLDEVIFTVAVLFRQRPDQHVAAVPECFNPVLAIDGGIGGCSPIIVVFDSEHGVFLQCSFKDVRAAKNPRSSSFYPAVQVGI